MAGTNPAYTSLTPYDPNAVWSGYARDGSGLYGYQAGGGGMQAGPSWTQIYGPAPTAMKYDSNGNLIHTTAWDKFDTGFSNAMKWGGIGLGVAAGGALAGGALAGAYGAGAGGAAAGGGLPAGWAPVAMGSGGAWGGAAGGGALASGAAASMPAWLTGGAKIFAPMLLSSLLNRGGGGGGNDMALPSMPNMNDWPGMGGYQQAGGDTGGYFDDPLSQPIMQAWNSRMSQLQQPSPGYGDISAAMSKYLNPDPRFNDAISKLFAASNSGAPSNAYTGQYAAATQKRMAELNAEPFSASDEAALKARFFDSLALDRDKAYDQVRQEMSSRGFAPTSGVGGALAADVSEGYQKARAGQQQSMLQYITDERNRRRDEAVSMSGALAQQGGQDAALQERWQVDKSGILGNIASALLNQSNVGLSAATQMAGLRRQSYMDDQSRGDALLQTSALPYSLEQQRMAQLQSILSGQNADSQQQFANYLALMGQQTNREQISANRNATMWNAGTQLGGPVLDAILRHYYPDNSSQTGRRA